MKELSVKYVQFEIYLAVQDVKKTKLFVKEQNINHIKVIKHLSRYYLRLLASAEYLLNDTSFFSFFTKKRGQKYFNIWHGTPLKTLGIHMEEMTDGANVQRNFYMADKIIVGNDFTARVLASSHGLNNVYQGQMVIAPSPRNSILLDRQKRQEIRRRLKIEHKKVVFYMPTWRGTVGHVKDLSQRTIEDLRYISHGINDDVCFFVKLHPFQQNIDLSAFCNIFSIPNELELYEFLSAVDLLITDYSSVMYDFLLTDKKIILYTYDWEEYFNTRGVYDQIERYPFTRVNTLEELITEIDRDDSKVDYREMRKEFCPHDEMNGVVHVCEYLFNNKPYEEIKETALYNGRETVVILGGGFWDNGVTTALLNTFDNIDLNKRNYIVLLGKHKLKKDYQFRIKSLPEEITFYPIPETLNAGVLDRFLYLGYMRFPWFYSSWIEKRVGELVEHDFYRLLGALKINHLIHYTGFGNRYGELMKQVPRNINTIMFIHTDMFKEYEAKKSFSKRIIFSAYNQVDKIAIVHSNLKAGLIKELPTIEEKLFVVNNFLGEKRIQKLSNEDLAETLRSTKIEHAITDVKLGTLTDFGSVKSRLLSDVQSDEMTCFINIGRYDYQKGHDRLIAAFEGVYLNNQNIRLIIIAPHGPLRQQTLALAKVSPAKEAIYILGRMSNPYPLLKSCNAFVLASRYEGLGLVVYEALAVGTAVITVNLTETIQYLQNNEAIITENSTEGIQKGMLHYLLNGSISPTFDFSVSRKRSLREFEALFDLSIKGVRK